MNIKLIHSDAKIPSKASEHSAGYDLYSCVDGVIAPNTRALIQTGIVLEIPAGYYGRIAPRSGLALKNGIDVMAGVVDSDYRGEVGIILYNSDYNKYFNFEVGDRIAQIIIEKYYNFEINKVELNTTTERNDGGFGSSGK